VADRTWALTRALNKALPKCAFNLHDPADPDLRNRFRLCLVGRPDENPEGRLEWVPLAGLQAPNLWEGDRLWLDFVFQRDAPTFHGVMPYRDGVMQSWSVSFV